jgi:Dynamitin
MEEVYESEAPDIYFKDTHTINDEREGIVTDAAPSIIALTAKQNKEHYASYSAYLHSLNPPHSHSSLSDSSKRGVILERLRRLAEETEELSREIDGLDQDGRERDVISGLIDKIHDDLSHMTLKVATKRESAVSVEGAKPLLKATESSQYKVKSELSTAQLESRVSRLEKMLGTSHLSPTASLNDYLSPSPTFTHSSTIVASITHLTHLSSLLTSSSTQDQTLTSLTTLTSQLDLLLTSKKRLAFESSLYSSPQSPSDAKIELLHGLIEPLYPLLQLIPTLIQRFVVLKRIHADALEFCESLKDLKKGQDGIEEMLTRVKKDVKGLEESFKVNQMIMDENIKIIKRR